MNVVLQGSKEAGSEAGSSWFRALLKCLKFSKSDYERVGSSEVFSVDYIPLLIEEWILWFLDESNYKT